MMAACVVSSFCGWTSFGRWRAVSVIYLVRSLSFEPASPLLPGLMAKETLNFFLLFKVDEYSSFSALDFNVHTMCLPLFPSCIVFPVVLGNSGS